MMQYACRVSSFAIDLQIIQEVPQVKTPPVRFFANFFRFQIIGAPLAWRAAGTASCMLSVMGSGLAAGLLAAVANIRIS
jgi:hypothetical protein